MRRSLRYLLFAAATAVLALAVTAVHGVAEPRGAVALYADGLLALYWVVVAVLLLRRKAPGGCGGDASASCRQRAVRFSTEGEPLARTHWAGRYRP
ncbi:hypothetical protein [Streptomyces sp. G45]|uniref:hypothetical protein n=1 Tax=Streptomyces sp. G45 TaxID=3406627 RepID=UPI003C1E865B